MATQSSNGRQADSRRNSSNGTAMLDRPEIHESAAENADQLQHEILRLVEASHEGRLEERGRADQFEGNDRRVIEGVNRILDAILLPIAEGNRILAQISNGKIDESIAQTYKGDHEKMKLAVNNIAVALQLLQKEMLRMSDLAKEGKLSERANPNQFKGSYAEIVKGVNITLDAIVLPIAEGNRILAQISNGKIDESIAQTYKGDHEKMKLAVNNVAGVLQKLQTELRRLVTASHEGHLLERGKPEQFQGAYAGIVTGVNEMLDAILVPIGEGNRILAMIRGGDLRERVEIPCKGDHERMKDAVNGVHGWLSELVAYVTQIANGDLTATMAKASDKDQIHEWLVLMKQNIHALVADTNMLAAAAVEGRVGAHADASQHAGEYRKIIEGVNHMLEAVAARLRLRPRMQAHLPPPPKNSPRSASRWPAMRKRLRFRPTLYLRRASKYRAMSLRSLRPLKRCRHRSARSPRTPTTRRTWRRMQWW